MTELSVELKRQILTQKLNLWKGTMYDASLDAKVSMVTENKNMQQSSEKRIKESLSAIEIIESLLGELNEPNREAGVDSDISGD